MPNPTLEVVAKPGAHMDYFAGNNPEGKTLRELTGEPMRCIPALRRPHARLELLDGQAIQASLMFPTLASPIADHPLHAHAPTQVAPPACNERLSDEERTDLEGRHC